MKIKVEFMMNVDAEKYRYEYGSQLSNKVDIREDITAYTEKEARRYFKDCLELQTQEPK